MAALHADQPLVLSSYCLGTVQPNIVAVEVMNDDLIASGLDTTAHTLMQASREVLAK
jgi:hypothetical protein